MAWKDWVREWPTEKKLKVAEEALRTANGFLSDIVFEPGGIFLSRDKRSKIERYLCDQATNAVVAIESMQGKSKA